MPESIKELAKTISMLPGIGEKTALKLAFFMLNTNKNYLENFSEQIKNIKTEISNCEICNSYTDKGKNFCEICRDNSRSKKLICIVEEYLDLVSIESSGGFSGVYHILGGAISPINGVFIGDLNFKKLFERISESEGNVEIILATNPNIEGEATNAYIKEEITKMGLQKFVKISKLSRGLSSGYIEYADNITLLNALKDRKEF